MVRARRALEQRDGHGRHEVEPGDALGRDEPQHLAGVEALEHHVAAAEHRHPVRGTPTVHVEQRDRVQHDVAVVAPHRQRAVDRVGGQRPMREHGALGVARRPARVEELADRVLVDRPRVEARPGRGDERGLVIGADVEARPGRERFRERREPGVHDEQCRLAVVEHEGELGRRHAHVERREHAAGGDRILQLMREVESPPA